MNCERCEEIQLRGLAGEASEEELAAARRHTDGCARCRARSSRDEATWRELGGWEVPALSDDAARRLRDRLAAETAARRRGAPRGWPSLVAAALLGVVVGIAAAPRSSTPRPGADEKHGFLLLLRRGPGSVEPAAGAERDRMIGRYVDWREGLERSGALRLSRLLDASTAIELRADVDGIARERVSPRERGEYVSGLFLVEASDLDAAEAIARSNPHLDYGGSIEVRPVVVPPKRGGA